MINKFQATKELPWIDDTQTCKFSQAKKLSPTSRYQMLTYHLVAALNLNFAFLFPIIVCCWQHWCPGRSRQKYPLVTGYVYFFLFFYHYPCAKEDIHMWPFQFCPPVGSHILFSGLCACKYYLSVSGLLLGHPGFLTPMYGLICMRPEAAPLLNVPDGGQGNRDQVSFPWIHRMVWLRVVPITLILWVQCVNHLATLYRC